MEVFTVPYAGKPNMDFIIWDNYHEQSVSNSNSNANTNTNTNINQSVSNTGPCSVQSVLQKQNQPSKN